MCVHLDGLIAATIILTGTDCKPIMDNPIFKSTSPSEFWTVRWNTLVQGVLARGVYVPLRKMAFPRVAAVVGTFLMSGLLHEWLLTSIYLVVDNETNDDGVCPDCYQPLYGGQTAFMLYMALLICLEKTIGHWKVFVHAAKNWPQPLLTMSMWALALPISHWFVDNYSMSDFFSDGSIAMPMIRPL